MKKKNQDPIQQQKRDVLYPMYFFSFYDILALLLYVCIMYLGMYLGGSINWLIVSSDQDHIKVLKGHSRSVG